MIALYAIDNRDITLSTDPSEPMMTPIDELRKRVQNYRDHISTNSSEPSETVKVATTISREALNKLMDSHPGSNGIRIYMSKEDNSGNDGVKFIVMPTAEGDTSAFADGISLEGGTVFMLDGCPSNACPPFNNSFSLIA